jgi:hypothetical protein
MDTVISRRIGNLCALRHTSARSGQFRVRWRTFAARIAWAWRSPAAAGEPTWRASRAAGPRQAVAVAVAVAIAIAIASSFTRRIQS